MDDEVEITYEKRKHETKKAVLFKINGEDKWIPKSQIIEEDETAECVLVTRWFAEKEGIG